MSEGSTRRNSLRLRTPFTPNLQDPASQRPSKQPARRPSLPFRETSLQQPPLYFFPDPMPGSQLSAAKLEEAAGTGGAPAATGAPPSHPHPALPAASSAPSFSHPPLPSPSSSSLPRLVPLMAADPLASMVKAEGGTAVGDGGDLGQGLVAASMPAGSLSSTATAPGSPPSYPSPPPPPAPASAEAKSSRLANARQPKGEKVNIVYRVVDGKQYIVGKQGRLFDPNPGPATTGAGDDAVFECCFCDKSTWARVVERPSGKDDLKGTAKIDERLTLPPPQPHCPPSHACLALLALPFTPALPPSVPALPHCLPSVYRGKHARSIWRRHLCDKHGIPLAAQPRRTRWDKGQSLRFSRLFTTFSPPFCIRCPIGKSD